MGKKEFRGVIELNANTSTNSTLFLEDFDIKNLSELFPLLEVGVRITTIYAQIARFSNNPSRHKEISILRDALSKAGNDKYRQYRYVSMTLQDIIVCFGDNLKSLPIASFIQDTPIGE